MNLIDESQLFNWHDIYTVVGAAVGGTESGAISFAVIGWVIILIVVILVAVYLYRQRGQLKRYDMNLDILH